MSRLLDICPGARAVIFFPLWDPQSNQWFAGSLAWTKDPGRILQSEDVTYLAGFGSRIMAEKSKVDALTADKSKADFISSISHELRTPLHGMLATLETMEETSKNTQDEEMIRTMTTCGEVLLDTMDHMYELVTLFRVQDLV
jgi:signal transduction histidine kinase